MNKVEDKLQKMVRKVNLNVKINTDVMTGRLQDLTFFISKPIKKKSSWKTTIKNEEEKLNSIDLSWLCITE